MNNKELIAIKRPDLFSLTFESVISSIMVLLFKITLTIISV